jgi:hypothetical protein
LSDKIVDESTDTVVVETIEVIEVVEADNDVVEIISDLTNDGTVTIIDNSGDVTVTETDVATVIVQEEDTDVVEACEVGPPGADGLSGVAIQIDAPALPINTTGVIDKVALALIRSVKWLITVRDGIASKYKYLEVGAVHNGVIASYYTVGHVGDSILIITNVIIVGGYMELQIMNNTINPLTISVIRIGTTV